MLGTMVLILFGTGGICQVVLGGSTKVVSAPKGDFLSLNTGWAVGKLRLSLAILPVMADAGAICRRRCGRRVDFRRHIWWTYQPCRALFFTVALYCESNVFVPTLLIRFRTNPCR